MNELDELQEINVNKGSPLAPVTQELTNDRLTPVSTSTASDFDHDMNNLNDNLMVAQEIISSSSSDSGLSSDNIDL